MNSQADSLVRAKENLPEHEKKIASYVLQHINKMIKENARNAPDVSRRYSISGLPVDSTARVLVNVTLEKRSRIFLPAQPEPVIKRIKKVGGKIKIISTGSRIEINCWIPYDKVKDIARLDEVGNISSIGIWQTNR